MAEDRKIIIDILKILYLEDGKINENKEWTPLTTQRIAEVLKDGGYTPKSAKLNPADFIDGWCIDDIKGNFEDDYPEMSDEVARYLLRTIDRNHDANIGISWDVMTDTLWNILQEIQKWAGRTLEGKFIPENEVHKYPIKDMMKMELVMSEEDAMSILEDLCGSHGDSPKHITPGEFEAAAKKWMEEHAKD